VVNAVSIRKIKYIASMRKTIIRTLLLLCLTAGSLTLNAQAPSALTLEPAQAAALKKQAQAMADAFIAADYATFTRHIYPPALQRSGGAAKMISGLKTAMASMKEQGVSFQGATIGEPTTLVRAGKEVHTFIQQELRMGVQGGTLLARSHLLAISADQGKTWTFLDAAPLTRESVKQIIPHFNLALPIPEKAKPVFLPDSKE
jgi:hypothetical protein